MENKKILNLLDMFSQVTADKEIGVLTAFENIVKEECGTGAEEKREFFQYLTKRLLNGATSQNP